ncbi:unnamed protein product [Caenorhabditis auriculariae]|uniref:Galactose mutarotase n=1 Tax=Caenorhabditis auriculariae TaxID=2777116 RepID=A0A8S1GV57_9PELO|nr:unnamed protein product [Caenorhabditis auriculariae]
MSDFIEIRNDSGLSVFVLPYGATLASIQFPAKDGKPIDLILGFATKEDYEKDTAYIGRTVGRVANRVKNAEFEFQGKKFELEANNPPHSLHGGSKGIAFKEWEVVRHSNKSVSLRVKVDDESDGFPGDAIIEVTYTVNDRNQLVIEHFATCTKPGVLALTNHAYWNLDGSETISDHILEVSASSYLPVDETCCPTGAILTVQNTDFDFRSPKSLASLADENKLIRLDNDLLLDPVNQCSPHCVRLRSDVSGIQLDISTSYPKRRFVWTEQGISIEAQFPSAALNFKNFADVFMEPGRQYCQEVVHTFSCI